MNQNQEKIKYFVYLRKSSEQEDKQVLSIESQEQELAKNITSEGLKVIDTLSESHSAKQRGQRPIFNKMIERIEKGEANAILLWNVNRLSRNAGDTGIVIDLMDTGKLLEVKTPSQTFRNLPNDKFLLNLFCSQAKLENDNRGVDSKRGMVRKAQMGWYPFHAPIGYKNTPNKKQGCRTIVKDKQRFLLIRKMFNLMLTGVYAPPKILKIATEDWGLKNTKGGNIARSAVYAMFTNSFYYGEYEFDGVWYQGKHEKMISKEEYDRIQVILGKRGKPRPQKKEFAFSGGLLRCGECGCGITAEHKTKYQKNGNVHEYIYYHCTKKKVHKKCSQKSLEQKKLEKQVKEILDSIEIPQEFQQWALDVLKEQNEKEFKSNKQIVANKQKEYNVCMERLDNLVDMRASGEIDEATFLRKQKQFSDQKDKAKELLSNCDQEIDNWLEKATELFSFAELARKRFEEGDIYTKREILNCLGSNLTLKDQKIALKIQKPLLVMKKAALEIKQEEKRLEPVKKFDLRSSLDKNNKWYPLIDTFRTLKLGEIENDLNIFIDSITLKPQFGNLQYN